MTPHLFQKIHPLLLDLWIIVGRVSLIVKRAFHASEHFYTLFTLPFVAFAFFVNSTELSNLWIVFQTPHSTLDAQGATAEIFVKHVRMVSRSMHC